MVTTSLVRRNCPPEFSKSERSPRFDAYRAALDTAIKTIAERKSIMQALDAAVELMEDQYPLVKTTYLWMGEQMMRNDLQCIERALREVLKDDPVIVESLLWCSVPIDAFDGELKAGVDLILECDPGNYKAVLFNMGKGKRGQNGRSLKTQAKGNLSCVVAKGALEKRYPGIEIWDVYLANPADTETAIAPDFYRAEKADSQIQVLSYPEFYENGRFCHEKFQDFLGKCVESGIPEPECILCEYAYECKQGVPLLKPRYEDLLLTEAHAGYKLPDFTAEQMEIIHHNEGAFLVVAGPGSGKTATLVGRIHYLVKEKNVPPEYILAITFTAKAADEIRERCTFLEEGENLNISTLNALGYNILLDHARESGAERFQLLTTGANYNIIDMLLDGRKKLLPGLSYAKKSGRTGLIATVSRRLEEYRKDKAIFYRKHPELTEEFGEFAEDYERTIREGNYITFDEQIDLCIELFKNHPDLLESYRQMYWYISVDEFQDINQSQCIFIDMLASGHGNLMAIGDDDQSIYEFRGGSPQYMIDFKKRYPKGKLYFLSKNFRSSEEIVNLAAGSINSGLIRLDKHIESAKGKGVPPEFREKQDLSMAVCDAIRTLMKQGYHADDIAVLAAKNATLSEIAASDDTLPLHLEKEMLCRSAFFTLLKDLLILAEGFENTDAIREYFLLYGLKMPDLYEFENLYLKCDPAYPYVENGNMDCALKILKNTRIYLSEPHKVSEFIEYVADIAGYKTQPVYEQLIDLYSDKRISILKDMLQDMQEMLEAGDEKRLDADSPGEVILTTAHESKGREWKAVVIADDFGYNDTPQTRRMIYVAITRAEERLIICKTPGRTLFEEVVSLCLTN